jgi:precorrin-2 dehydrogenase
MGFYPVFLDLRDRPCLVVSGAGGGELAAEKARGLAAAGAAVAVIAEHATPALADLAASGSIAHLQRRYRPGDLEGVLLAVVLEADAPTVAAIWEEARARGTLVNTVDDPSHCHFIAPALVQRGDLTVAISTAGKAPALAVRLRQRLERMLGDEHARFLALAGSVRARLAARWPDFATRKERWYRLVDSDVLELLRQGDEAAARGRFAEILGVMPGAGRGSVRPAERLAAPPGAHTKERSGVERSHDPREGADR